MSKELLTSTTMHDTIDTNEVTVPPWHRIAVNGKTAAAMMGCSRSTFFARVKDGIYPKAGPDGQWSVSALRAVHQANQPTTA